MPKMIQPRNVPDQLHRKLKSRAAIEGMSLSDYLLREIRAVADLPTWDEMRERLAQHPPIKVERSDIVRSIRELQDSRL